MESEADAPVHPDVAAPERRGAVRSMGLSLATFEWGDPAAPPLLLCHGMFDHARGFDGLAPRLAERWRVIAFDARGHGESDWADAYHWPVDVVDIVAVLRSLGRPAHLVGHSKGGGQATEAAVAAPHLVRQLVNIDGFGPPPLDELVRVEGRFRPRDPATALTEHLDARRAADTREWRLYPSLEALVERRRAQNPRLADRWLRYLVYHAARREAGGWRWKADPTMGRGAGPFRPDWVAPGWQGLRAPMLALTGTEPDYWGPLTQETLADRLGYVTDFEHVAIEEAGHFVHMEQPRRVAELMHDFLDS